MLKGIPQLYERCVAYIQSQMLTPTPSERLCKHRPSITLSRQAGIPDHIIVSRLVELLETMYVTPDGKSCPWGIFDKNLIQVVLAEYGLPENISDFLPEDRISYLQSLFREILGVHPPTWTLHEYLKETMRNLAKLGGVIIVGRGANFATLDIPNVFHVRIVGSIQTRIKYLTSQEGISEKDIRAKIEKEDKARARFVKEVFNADIDDPNAYHLIISFDRFTPEEIATLIAACIQNHWGLDKK